MAKSEILSRLERKLSKLQVDMEKVIIPDSVRRTSEELKDIQAFQMQKGEDNLGGGIGRLRSTIYARRKKAKGGIAPEGAVDLKNTGAFQRGLIVHITSDGALLDSTEGKKDELVEKYGEKIFGLNEESSELYQRVLAPVITFETQRYIDKR